MAIPSPIVWQNTGLLREYDTFRAWLNDPANNVKLRLYSNNYTPVHTSLFANFTECSFVGYVAKTPNFGAAFLNIASQAEIDAAAETWTFTAGAGTTTIFGIYLTYDTGGGDTVICAAKFAVPVTLTVGSPNTTHQMQLTGQSVL